MQVATDQTWPDLARLGQTRPDQNRLGGSGLPGGSEVTIQGLIFLTLDATTVY